MLAIIETHPIQYRSPVYQVLCEQFNLPLTVIYGSDFSVAGYKDREFGAKFSWDIDLLSGYPHHFLSKVKEGGAKSMEEVSARKLSSTLQKLNPQAILITGYNHRLHRSAIYLGLRNKYPLLFRAETTDLAITRHPLKSWGRDVLLRALYERCDYLLYIGINSKSHYQRLGCPDYKLVESLYCVNPAPFQLDEISHTEYRQQVRQHLQISNDKVLLIFSGKLSERKRPDLILKAIKQLPAEKRQKLAILYLGDGELRAALEYQAKSEPQVDAYFVGFQNQTKLSQYYHASDALILPSAYSETWGLVVNEAMHHGLPAIVSDVVGCKPDLIIPGVTGEVFQVDSIDSLADAISRLMPIVNQLDTRRICLEHISQYSIEKAAAGIAQAYQSIVSK